MGETEQKELESLRKEVARLGEALVAERARGNYYADLALADGAQGVELWWELPPTERETIHEGARTQLRFDKLLP